MPSFTPLAEPVEPVPVAPPPTLWNRTVNATLEWYDAKMRVTNEVETTTLLGYAALLALLLLVIVFKNAVRRSALRLCKWASSCRRGGLCRKPEGPSPERDPSTDPEPGAPHRAVNTTLSHRVSAAKFVLNPRE